MENKTNHEANEDYNIVISSYSLRKGKIVGQKLELLSAKWDEKHRPISVSKSRTKRRQKVAIRASIIVLENNQETHQSIHDGISTNEDMAEQFPTNRRPERRPIGEMVLRTRLI